MHILDKIEQLHRLETIFKNLNTRANMIIGISLYIVSVFIIFALIAYFYFDINVLNTLLYMSLGVWITGIGWFALKEKEIYEILNKIKLLEKEIKQNNNDII